jgi:hypothetical protein
MTSIDELLSAKKLKQVQLLDEIKESHSFLVDTIRTDNLFTVYPIVRPHLTHDLLSLFGTHWAYSIGHDWQIKKKMEGDEEQVLHALKDGARHHRKARFCFTQKNLDESGSLWLFVPDTEGWRFYQDVLIHRYKEDDKLYQTKKAEMIRHC